MLIGRGGQVGYELLPRLQDFGRVAAPNRTELDLTNLDAIREMLRRLRPALIVNAAAYTAVEAAEQNVSLAMQINGDAVGVLSQEAKRLGAVLLHYSTDYVFDGTKKGAYAEDDLPNPQNVYGLTKLAGEQAICEIGGAHLILRTSWVYGWRGKNFLKAILQAAAEQSELRVAVDQIGAPTWSITVADMTARLLSRAYDMGGEEPGFWLDRSGIYHFTASGETSRWDFAKTIIELAPLLVRPKVIPISSYEYPSSVKRPANCLLDNQKLEDIFALRGPSWYEALAVCLGSEGSSCRSGPQRDIMCS